MGSIRVARLSDVDRIADLAQQKRKQYAAYEPTFWRIAANALAIHRAYLAQVIQQESALCLVSDNGDGDIDGFIIGKIVEAPPVYDPGGPTCVVDDYWVQDGDRWDSVGEPLLAAVCREALRRFVASQVVVVCGHRDNAKRSLLARAGFHLGTEWYVQDLREGPYTNPS
jgi:hypothetical protein